MMFCIRFLFTPIFLWIKTLILKSLQICLPFLINLFVPLDQHSQHPLVVRTADDECRIHSKYALKDKCDFNAEK